MSAVDLVIRNARVRGQPEVVDIGVTEARIAAVGPRLPGVAREEIDAAGGRCTIPW